MASFRRLAPPLVAAAALLAALNAVYVVGQGRQGVLLRLGQPAAAINAGPLASGAGLHLKWPFVDQVASFDRRFLMLQTHPVELAGSAPTALQAQMRFRIVDPLRFYRALGDSQLGRQRLTELLQDSLERRLTDAGVAVGDRSTPDRAMLSDLRAQAAAGRFGVDILDVRLTDAALSTATLNALSRRMQDAETEQVGQIRVQGEQHKQELLAQADRDAANVRGDGERQALDIRGDGDAQRTAVLGEAYGKDPAFARFFRRLEAYDQAFNPDNTTLVLSPDNAFLELFGHGPDGQAKPPP